LPPSCYPLPLLPPIFIPPCTQLLLLHNPHNSRANKTATIAFKFLLSSYMQHCDQLPDTERRPTPNDAN
jgi:hypothetical protein